MAEISVIMGVRCGTEKKPLLERAVRSILSQTHVDFELLICDDGSSCEIMELLEEYSAHDGRIKLLRRCDRLTLAQKLNYCIAHAGGRYVARMDDDDYSRPQRFEKQVEYLSEHEDIAFVGCNTDVLSCGKKIGEYVFPEQPSAKDFRFTQPFIHSTIMFRLEVLNEVGGYSENTNCILCEDYELLMRMYAHGLRGANLGERLLEYTVAPELKTNRTLRHRWNECVTRFHSFRKNGLLPLYLVYVIKPLAVWLVPPRLLCAIKKKRIKQYDP